jgi:uncharacterized membrane protein
MTSKPRHFYRNGFLLTAGLGVLVVLATLPPFVPEAVADALMAAFAPVCHQLPGRSPHIDGTALAACHRCYGAYLGFVGGSFAFVLSRGRILPGIRPVLILVLAALPGFVDWSGDVVGLWTNAPVSRVTTGAWFGLLASLLLASAVLMPAGKTSRDG